MTIKSQIKKTLKRFQNKQRVENRLKELDSIIKKENYKLSKLIKLLEKEATDIAKLEKMSLKSIFYKALGSKEKQLEKERQDYLHVSLKYDETRKSIDLLEYERSVLAKKMTSLQGVENELERLLKKREVELLKENPKAAKQIRKFIEKSRTQQRLIFEIKEAVTVGKEALHVLEQIISYLRKARNWGQWDMAGKRRHTGHYKHSNIDRAKDMAFKAKIILQSFEKELADIHSHQRFDFSIKFDSFGRFTDIFFDNLISDWIVQQKINNSLSNIQAVHDKVFMLIQSLQADIPKIENHIRQLEKARKKIALY